MTPARFVLIVTVIVVILFGVSLTVQNKRQHDQRMPINSWVNNFNKRFEERQKIDLTRDLQSDCLREGQLFVPKLRSQCSVRVLTNEDRSVRKAELRLSGPDSFGLRYEPSPADPEAVKLEIEKVNAGQPVKLVFLKHGGTLTIIRKGTLADAVIAIK